MGGEGEQGGMKMSGGERGGALMALLDPRLEEINMGDKNNEGWDKDLADFKRFEERKSRSKEGYPWKRGDTNEMKDETENAEESIEEEKKIEFEKDQQNKMKEDEGGGSGDIADGETDRRECRCTQYAISSGLSSAMMILSYVYFLVPLCILGLVYTLIGRTLWLRPKSSRRDQSHRSTVKMLGKQTQSFD